MKLWELRRLDAAHANECKAFLLSYPVSPQPLEVRVVPKHEHTLGAHEEDGKGFQLFGLLVHVRLVNAKLVHPQGGRLKPTRSSKKLLPLEQDEKKDCHWQANKAWKGKVAATQACKPSASKQKQCNEEPGPKGRAHRHPQVKVEALAAEFISPPKSVHFQFYRGLALNPKPQTPNPKP